MTACQPCFVQEPLYNDHGQHRTGTANLTPFLLHVQERKQPLPNGKRNAKEEAQWGRGKKKKAFLLDLPGTPENSNWGCLRQSEDEEGAGDEGRKMCEGKPPDNF